MGFLNINIGHALCVCVCVCVCARIAGEFGYFEVEGCQGASPNLIIAADQEYRFIQQDISNWYHPIGFAYFPDGKFECLRLLKLVYKNLWQASK